MISNDRPNKICTGHGKTVEFLHKWGKLTYTQCDCGNTRQTMFHIVQKCASRAYAGNPIDVIKLTPPAVEWVKNLNIALCFPIYTFIYKLFQCISLIFMLDLYWIVYVWIGRILNF